MKPLIVHHSVKNSVLSNKRDLLVGEVTHRLAIDGFPEEGIHKEEVGWFEKYFICFSYDCHSK